MVEHDAVRELLRRIVRSSMETAGIKCWYCNHCASNQFTAPPTHVPATCYVAAAEEILKELEAPGDSSDVLTRFEFACEAFREAFRRQIRLGTGWEE